MNARFFPKVSTLISDARKFAFILMDVDEILILEGRYYFVIVILTVSYVYKRYPQ